MYTAQASEKRASRLVRFQRADNQHYLLKNIKIMIRNFSFVKKNCYMVNQENNSLEFFEPISFTINLSTGILTYTAKVGGILREVEIPQDPNLKLFFDSNEDFIAGNETMTDNENIDNLFYTITGGFKLDNPLFVWTSDGINQKRLRIETLTIRGDFKTMDGSHYFIIRPSVVGIDTPIFSSKSYAQNFGEYDIVEGDGSKKHIVGGGRKIQLTEEQRKVLDEFLDAAKKLRNANIQLVYDYSDCCISAINDSGVKKLYSFESDDETAISLDPYIREALDVDIFDYSESLMATFKD